MFTDKYRHATIILNPEVRSHIIDHSVNFPIDTIRSDLALLGIQLDITQTAMCG